MRYRDYHTPLKLIQGCGREIRRESPTLFSLGLQKVVRESNEDQKIEIIGQETGLTFADDNVFLRNT